MLDIRLVRYTFANLRTFFSLLFSMIPKMICVRLLFQGKFKSFYVNLSLDHLNFTSKDLN